MLKYSNLWTWLCFLQAARQRASSIDFITKMGLFPNVKSSQIVPQMATQPFTKDMATRLALGRIEIVKRLIEALGKPALALASRSLRCLINWVWNKYFFYYKCLMFIKILDLSLVIVLIIRIRKLSSHNRQRHAFLYAGTRTHIRRSAGGSQESYSPGVQNQRRSR